ncbi:MAG: flagellar biosynthetic protein FliO [Terriglobia bacterium]
MLRFIITAIGKLMNTGQSIRFRRKEKSMRLCETLALGDRRYLAVVRVEGQRFLLGAAGNSISLLTRLPSLVDAGESLPGAAPDGVFDPEEYKIWQ